jgi:TRAP-type mannitol/chloroaromatic compound transport system permease small subunit
MSVDTGSRRTAGRSGDFPPIYYAVIRTIDSFSDITGRLISLTMLFLVGAITYEVIMRYFFRSPTVWVFESSTMANGSAFMLGCAYALYKGAHVRTDIFWEMYPERTKGWVDLVSYVVLFFPVMITIMMISIDDVIHSYVTGERSQESLFRAIMWPFRAVIPLSAVLFMIQGVSEVLKCIYQIRYGREFVHREKLEV